jgi:hypothetical protein
MRLAEVFDYQGQAPNWVEDDYNVFVSFSIGEREYHVSMDSDDGRIWNVQFALVINDGEDYEYGMSDAGNEMKVFAVVVNIIKRFVSEYDPVAIEFAADTANRQSLYNTIVRRVFPGWKVKPQGDKFVAIRQG